MGRLFFSKDGDKSATFGWMGAGKLRKKTMAVGEATQDVDGIRPSKKNKRNKYAREGADGGIVPEKK
jgi:hypothetical protein